MKLEVVELKELSCPLFEELVALEEAAFGRGGLNEWTLPVVMQYGKIFILKRNEEISGIAELIKYWQDPDSAFLINFSIKEAQRKKGLGKKFLAHILKNLQNENIKKVCLTVSPSNVAAINLYTKNYNFHQIEFLKDEYGSGQDRLLLEIDLRES